MNKIYFYVDKHYPVASTVHSYTETMHDIHKHKKKIRTTQMTCMTTSLLDDYEIYVMKNGKQELSFGKIDGQIFCSANTDREIKFSNNLWKMYRAGAFK